MHAPYVAKVLSAWAKYLKLVRMICGRQEETVCASTLRLARMDQPHHSTMAVESTLITNVTVDNSLSEVTTLVLTVLWDILVQPRLFSQLHVNQELTNHQQNR
jgi:hypothetical protein